MFNKIVIDGKEIAYRRIDNDINGNPRYLFHYSSLGLSSEEYNNSKFLSSIGVRKYRGKDFNGGLVITSYSLEDSLKFTLDKIKKLKGE